MGNESTKPQSHETRAGQDAIQKQQELLARKYQEVLDAQKQDKEKQDAMEKAIDALKSEKLLYQKKSMELQIKLQHQQAREVQKEQPIFVNPNIVQENKQNASCIYPNLPNFDHSYAQRNVTQYYNNMPHTSTSSNINTYSSVPSAPPAPFNPHPAPANIGVASNYSRYFFPTEKGGKKNVLYGDKSLQDSNDSNSGQGCLSKTGLQMAKCPNAEDGCCLHFKNRREIIMHLKECPFNIMTCPLKPAYDDCSWEGKLNQLREHFKENHPEHCVGDVNKEMTLLNIKDSSRIMYLVALGRFYFLIHIKVDGKEGNIVMSVQMLGTTVSASKWSYQIDVYNKKTPKRKWQFTDTCYSHAVPVDDLFNDAKCAVINSLCAETFSNNGQLNYKFYIKKENYKARKENTNN